MGEVGVVTFFVLEVPDYESAMLIYFYIIQSWTKVSGQPRKNSITVQKEKTR